jgi:fructosamine-3-kinase
MYRHPSFTEFNSSETFERYKLTKNKDFNSIVSEASSLKYLLTKFSNLFPTVVYHSNELLIIDFIENNNIRNNKFQKILADNILKIHKVTNSKYGFKFDTQIGGLKQSNKFSDNWLDFFRDNRLNMIFEKINKDKPMPNLINKRIEKLLKNLGDIIPNKPKVSLLHGDLWSGNILFNNGKLAGLIDPGVYFGHNELEISYLTWFKYVDDNFLNYYSERFTIDKHYFKYEPAYQLYFSLLNVHLWSRKYITDTENLLNKII